jgi:hypothetical protein
MLSTKLLAMIAVIWVLGIIMGSTYSYNNTEATWSGSSSNSANSVVNGGSGQVTDIEYLMNYKNAVQTINVLGVIPLPVPNGKYFEALFGIMLLRFSFLVDNPYGTMFWLVFCMPLAIMGMLGLVLTFINIIRGVVSWV